MLTAASEEDAVIEAVAAGATGYLQRYSGKEKLLRTVRDVAEGEYRIPGDVMKRVFAGLRAGAPQPTHGLNRLTAREQRYSRCLRGACRTRRSLRPGATSR